MRRAVRIALRSIFVALGLILLESSLRFLLFSELTVGRQLAPPRQ